MQSQTKANKPNVTTMEHKLHVKPT